MRSSSSGAVRPLQPLDISNITGTVMHSIMRSQPSTERTSAQLQLQHVACIILIFEQDNLAVATRALLPTWDCHY